MVLAIKAAKGFQKFGPEEEVGSGLSFVGFIPKSMLKDNVSQENEKEESD
jgi:hypothetical protein